MGVRGENTIRSRELSIPNPWRGDTILLNSSRGVPNKFYLQNIGNGIVVALKVKNFENINWSDVLIRNDTLYTISQKNEDTSYLYSILENQGKVYSLLIKTDTLSLPKWSLGDFQEAVGFKITAPKENVIYIKRTGIQFEINPMRIVKDTLFDELISKSVNWVNVQKSSVQLKYFEFKDTVKYGEGDWN